MQETPILINLNLANKTIIISSNKYYEGFDMFIAKILILIKEVEEHTTLTDVEYTSNTVSPIQTEITFISDKFVAIVYTYLVKEIQ